MQNLASYIWWFLVFTVDLVLKIKKSWNFWKIYKLLDFNDTVDAPASTVTGSLFIELSIKMYNWWRCLVQQVQNSTTRGKKGNSRRANHSGPKSIKRREKPKIWKQVLNSEMLVTPLSSLLPSPPLTLPIDYLSLFHLASITILLHKHQKNPEGSSPGQNQ